MYKLGITGGIGSGKSTAAKYFSNKNAYIIDADAEAKHCLLHSISLQNKIMSAFGSDLKSKAGQIDLKELSKRAFSDINGQKILNGIIWPELYLVIEKKMILSEHKYNIFIVDAALLFEANLQNLFDDVLLITANENIRINRASNRLKIGKQFVIQRMNLQMPESQKIKLTKHIIYNNETITHLNKELENFYMKIVLPHL